jgi:Fur family ferric uptake transcriptional regulator
MSFEELLLKHDLKRTKPRLSVLNILSSRKAAMSQPDLEGILGMEVDRVTLYRVLKAFEEKGIIHKIIDLSGTANYAICSELCSVHEHHDNHVHFNCKVCNQVYCLDSLNIPSITLPTDFSADSINLIVYGTCSICNKSIQDQVN